MEFEFRSSNFKVHGHDPRKVDWIVCWEDDWVDKPKSIKVIELRDEYGLGWGCWWHFGQVWNEADRSDGYSPDGFHPYSFGAQAVFKDIAVPSRAKIGDLVFCYLNGYRATCERLGLDKKLYAITTGEYRCWLLGLSCITAISSNRVIRRMNGNSASATIRRVVAFQPPISGNDVFGHPSVNCWNGLDLTAQWPEIRRRLIQLRPEIEAKLSRYS